MTTPNSFDKEKFKKAVFPLLLLIAGCVLLWIITKNTDPRTIPQIATETKTSPPLKMGATSQPEEDPILRPTSPAPPRKRPVIRDLTQTTKTLVVTTTNPAQGNTPPTPGQTFPNLPDMGSIQKGAQTAIDTLLTAMKQPQTLAQPITATSEPAGSTLYKGTTLIGGDFGHILIRVYQRETGLQPAESVDFLLSCTFSGQAKTAQLQCPEFLGGTRQKMRHQTPTRVLNAFLTGIAGAGSDYITDRNTIGLQINSPDIKVPVTSYAQVKPGQPVLLLPAN